MVNNSFSNNKAYLVGYMGCYECSLGQLVVVEVECNLGSKRRSRNQAVTSSWMIVDAVGAAVSDCNSG